MESKSQAKGWETVYEVRACHDCRVVKAKTFDSEEQARAKTHEYALALKEINEFNGISPTKWNGEIHGYQPRKYKGSVCHFPVSMESKVVKA